MTRLALVLLAFVQITTTGAGPGHPSTGVSPVTYGPSPTITCPVGAVQVSGDSGSMQVAIANNVGATTFCLTATTHLWTQSVTPKSGNTIIGAYGAILDGSAWVSADGEAAMFRSVNNGITGVTIKNLVMRDGPQYGVNAYLTAANWTVSYNEITGFKNGVSTGTGGTVANNWIHHNSGIFNDPDVSMRGGGYTFNSAIGTVLRDNDISYNGQEQKFIYATSNEPNQNLTLTGNYVHHNLGDGLWIDGDGAGSLIENNIVEDNARNGIVVEIGTTVTVRNNTLRRHLGGEALLISASRSCTVTGNVLEANVLGIGLFLDFTRLVEVYPFWTVDLTNNTISGNTITVPSGGGAYAALLSFTGVGSQTPYLNNTKNNNFQSNTYIAPSNPTTGTYFIWNGTKTFAQWQALPQDSLGTIQ